MKKKMLLTTIGTLGDLNPLIALAKTLLESGIDVHIAACEAYRHNVERESIHFISVSPHYDPKSKDLCDAILHPLKTLPYFYKHILNKENLESAITDFDKIICAYDVVVGNVFSYAAKISCLKNEIKWVSINLSPTCFFSKFDPPSLYPLTFLNGLSFGRSFIFSIIYNSIFKLVDYWGRDIHNVYKNLNLKTCGNLLREAPFSRHLNLAMYSRALGTNQTDWPDKTIQTGFLFYSAQSDRDLSDLDNFIDRFESSPILFTFGSTALVSFEKHYPMILKVASEIGKKYNRAVILTLDRETITKFKNKVDDHIYLCDYLPYTEYMHKMGLIIHQGGIGTVSPCLKAGIPQIILPGCTDQFDNAYRISRMGVGTSIALKRLSQARLEKAMCSILDKPQFKSAAQQAKNILNSEDSKSQIVVEIKKLLSIT